MCVHPVHCCQRRFLAGFYHITFPARPRLSALKFRRHTHLDTLSLTPNRVRARILRPPPAHQNPHSWWTTQSARTSPFRPSAPKNGWTTPNGQVRFDLVDHPDIKRQGANGPKCALSSRRYRRRLRHKVGRARVFLIGFPFFVLVGHGSISQQFVRRNICARNFIKCS